MENISCIENVAKIESWKTLLVVGGGVEMRIEGLNSHSVYGRIRGVACKTK